MTRYSSTALRRRGMRLAALRATAQLALAAATAVIGRYVDGGTRLAAGAIFVLVFLAIALAGKARAENLLARALADLDRADSQLDRLATQAAVYRHRIDEQADGITGLYTELGDLRTAYDVLKDNLWQIEVENVARDHQLPAATDPAFTAVVERDFPTHIAKQRKPEC